MALVDRTWSGQIPFDQQGEHHRCSSRRAAGAVSRHRRGLPRRGEVQAMLAVLLALAAAVSFGGSDYARGRPPCG
jgi:hypothetical protein